MQQKNCANDFLEKRPKSTLFIVHPIYLSIRQFNNIDFSSEVSTVHKFVYTDEALLLDRQ